MCLRASSEGEKIWTAETIIARLRMLIYACRTDICRSDQIQNWYCRLVRSQGGNLQVCASDHPHFLKHVLVMALPIRGLTSICSAQFMDSFNSITRRTIFQMPNYEATSAVDASEHPLQHPLDETLRWGDVEFVRLQGIDAAVKTRQSHESESAREIAGHEDTRSILYCDDHFANLEVSDIRLSTAEKPLAGQLVEQLAGQFMEQLMEQIVE
ncbi:hypothetical protein ANO11243_033120 [Dothideomycetidae sp. 11243]|nr:hypothetical protein ANO11243_033120 [fungal sp. No.11243]